MDAATQKTNATKAESKAALQKRLGERRKRMEAKTQIAMQKIAESQKVHPQEEDVRCWDAADRDGDVRGQARDPGGLMDKEIIRRPPARWRCIVECIHGSRCIKHLVHDGLC